jgi:hypothetical protein
MKSIKAKKDFTLNNVDYFVGDEVKTKDISEIIRLNEKGFIEPLSRKEITLIQRELINKKSEEE